VPAFYSQEITRLPGENTTMTGTQANVVLRHLRQFAAAGQAGPMSDGELLERFAARREEGAFAALVRRHGPLVLGVCRRVLHDGHDAEDAFQATFLALARKAGDVGRAPSVAGWLYRVAYHVAVKALARKAARQQHERRAAVATPADPVSEVTGRELLRVLDDELHRLPEQLRAPLVLCYLEGKTRDEAARELGWSLGTLKRRLEQGRGHLHARLARRGMALAALLAAGAGAAVVPAALAATTTGAALLVAAGNPAAVPARVVSLMAEALRATTAVRRKAVGAALLLAVTLIGTSVGLLAYRGPAPAGADPTPATAEAPKPGAAARPAGPAAADGKEMTITGRVLDTAGQPVAEAELAVVGRNWDFAAKDYQVLSKGSADGGGRFRLTVPRLSFGEGYVLAGKPGHGLGQQLLNPAAEWQEMTFALPPEQPLRGRLLDLQGQPAAGVKVSVTGIGTRDDVSLAAPAEGLPLWPKPATSDAEGRFTLAGLPRNQEAGLLAQSDRFAWQPLRLAADNGEREMTWTLSPARLLEGKVVHEDTGKAAANARFVVRPQGVTGGADGSGRFRLNLPPPVGERQLALLFVYPAEGEPYLPVRQEVAWPQGAVKHEIEVKLPRGVLVRGRVTEAQSGRPVAGAGVQFLPREVDNPNRRPNVLTQWDNLAASGADGSFRLAVPPGPGHLLVSGPGRDFVQEEAGRRAVTVGKPGGHRLHADGLVPLDLAPGAGPTDVAVRLRRGVSVRGRLLGPAGQPVARAVMACGLLMRAVPSDGAVEVRDGVFALHGCDPDKDYAVHFFDADHGWGASVTLSGRRAEDDPVTVRLAPCGGATARFVDAEGKPLPDQPARRVMFRLVVTPGPSYEESVRKGVLAADEEFAESLVSRKERMSRRGLKTDAEGRVTYAGLIPGATYRLLTVEKESGVVRKEFRAEAGKTLDLGDVMIGKGE
jgi:RNA polymerase sigma factor (sigma-70 family)